MLNCSQWTASILSCVLLWCRWERTVGRREGDGVICRAVLSAGGLQGVWWSGQCIDGYKLPARQAKWRWLVEQWPEPGNVVLLSVPPKNMKSTLLHEERKRLYKREPSNGRRYPLGQGRQQPGRPHSTYTLIHSNVYTNNIISKRCNGNAYSSVSMGGSPGLKLHYVTSPTIADSHILLLNTK